MKRKGASGSEAAIPILPANSGPEFQREFIIWQVNGEKTRNALSKTANRKRV